MTDDLTRPIIGIENRTAQEAFDIMCDRIEQERLARKSPSPQPHTGRAGVTEATEDQINAALNATIGASSVWNLITVSAFSPFEIMRAALNAALTVEPVAPTKDEIRNEIARREEAGVDARVPLTGPAKFKDWSDADLRSAEPEAGEVQIGVDELAQHIRIVDGENSLGAGALAEKLLPFILRHAKVAP